MRSSILAAFVARLGLAIAARPHCLVDDNLATQPLGSSSLLTTRQTNSSVLPTTLPVDVHIHITSTTPYANLITPETVSSQFSYLQSVYATYNITLTLASTTFLTDDLAGAGWLVHNSTTNTWDNFPLEQAAFYNRTRLGGYDALNLYFFAPWSPGASGYCTFPVASPSPPQEGEEAFYMDRCEISALTMPGVPRANATLEGYTQGHVAVHEAGHWFGLNHTFAGGCNGMGDFVSDTPATGIVYDCPVSSDTCPEVEGVDPIHNFMSYTNDSCTYEFTPGQKERMFETFFTYRRGGE